MNQDEFLSKNSLPPEPPEDRGHSEQGMHDLIRSTSPIRPVNPDSPPKTGQPLAARPTLPAIPGQHPDTESPRIPEPTGELSPAEKAQKALETLREKMINVTHEFNEGKINQAQFHAIYRRYAEQEEITARLLARDPESGAWQSVVQAGHTSFLRDHFAARIISYGLYEIEKGQQIVLQGKIRLPQSQLMPIFRKLSQLLSEGRTPQIGWRKLKDDSWVVMVPGKYTASVIIFSAEPAPAQRQKVEDIQRDFERANEKLLARGQFSPAQLVYPHRILFE